MKKISGFIFLSLLFVSCASYKTIPKTQLHNSKIVRSINKFRITLNNGENVQMKVREIDSLKISGVQLIIVGNKQHEINKIIVIDDIKSIKIRKFSITKTLALAYILGGTALIITHKQIPVSRGCCTALNSLQLNLNNP